MSYRHLHRAMLTAVLFTCLAWPAAAADLGGTAWILGGTAKTKVKKVGHDGMSLPEVVLQFDEDGTCVLSLEPSMPTAIVPQFDIDCTWSSGEGRRFTVDFDDEDLVDAMQALFQATLGFSPDSIQVTTEKAKGKVSKKMDRIRLRVRVKGMVQGTVEGSTVERKGKLRLVLTGTPAEG